MLRNKNVAETRIYELDNQPRPLRPIDGRGTSTWRFRYPELSHVAPLGGVQEKSAEVPYYGQKKSKVRFLSHEWEKAGRVVFA